AHAGPGPLQRRRRRRYGLQSQGGTRAGLATGAFLTNRRPAAGSYFPATVSSFPALLADIRACTLCAPHLPLGPRPVVRAHPASRILLAGQAPGRRVHETGIPFNDPSGDRLRQWLGVDRET